MSLATGPAALSDLRRTRLARLPSAEFRIAEVNVVDPRCAVDLVYPGTPDQPHNPDQPRYPPEWINHWPHGDQEAQQSVAADGTEFARPARLRCPATRNPQDSLPLRDLSGRLVVQAPGSRSGHKEADANDLTGAGILAGLAGFRSLLRLRLRQAVALVLYIDGDLGQRLGVLAAMVRTEKQLS